MAEEIRPRIRVPAVMSRAQLLTSVAFRGLGAARADDGGDGEDEDMTTAGPAADEADGDGNAPPAPKRAKRKKAKAKTRAAPAEDEEDADPDGDGDDDEDPEGDDDADAGDMRRASTRAPRLRERSRIAHILEHPSARANLDAALTLALNTSLPRSEALAVLDGLPRTAAGAGLAERMAQFGGHRPGAGGPPMPKGQAAVDASWDAAGRHAGIPGPARAP